MTKEGLIERTRAAVGMAGPEPLTVEVGKVTLPVAVGAPGTEPVTLAARLVELPLSGVLEAAGTEEEFDDLDGSGGADDEGVGDEDDEDQLSWARTRPAITKTVNEDNFIVVTTEKIICSEREGLKEWKGCFWV